MREKKTRNRNERAGRRIREREENETNVLERQISGTIERKKKRQAKSKKTRNREWTRQSKKKGVRKVNQNRTDRRIKEEI